MVDSVTLSAVPEPEVHWRPLSLEERIVWTPALRMKYTEGSKYGLYNLSDREWDLMAIHGEIVLVEAPEPVACIVYGMYEDFAELHCVHWDSLGQGSMSDIASEACSWLLSEYPELLRIEVRIPGDVVPMERLAQKVGFRQVGIIPNGGRLRGEIMDLLYYVLPKEL